jgi:signal transduction histidine kinase
LSTTCQINPIGFEKPRPAANLPSRLPEAPLAEMTLPAMPPASTELLERSLAELVRYYRHSAAGRRCHGLIHNLHAPLQVLSFQVELLMQKAAEEETLLTDVSSLSAQQLLALVSQRQHRLQQMRQEIDNIHAMTRRLTHQGLHEDLEDSQYLNLNRLYQDELALYEDNLFFKHQVKKEFSFETDFPQIHGHYLDFSQSFRNLVDNALEAMETSPMRALTVATKLEGKSCLLRIGDTGHGIPPGAEDRIFEPFFTTKGTPDKPRAGLGLYMAQRLLLPYGGRIHLESKPGETWVTLTLPIP